MNQKWQPGPNEIINGLRQSGWNIELAHDTDDKRFVGWHVVAQKENSKADAYGATKLSTLWALVLELVKLIPEQNV
jgi:hypothetical protein